MIKFLFDLDGTITQVETLPFIAKHFQVEKFPNQMAEMTKESLLGNISFEESFTARVAMLKHLPVDKIADLLANIPLFSALEKFIFEHKNDCALVTGNIGHWVESLCQRIGCERYTSTAFVEDNRLIKILNIIKKENIVKKYQDAGYYVIFIGDSNNDLEAMRQANCSILSALLHNPIENLREIADYCIYDENMLYQLLTFLYKNKR